MTLQRISLIPTSLMSELTTKYLRHSLVYLGLKTRDTYQVALMVCSDRFNPITICLIINPISRYFYPFNTASTPLTNSFIKRCNSSFSALLKLTVTSSAMLRLLIRCQAFFTLRVFNDFFSNQGVRLGGLQ